MQVGVSLIPNAEDHDKLIELARAAERAGLDMIGIQDHPYQRKFLDTFLLIADLLARTERIAFFPDVANLPLRPPALLAKAAASLDSMSGGRFDLGLGSGSSFDRAATMGAPRRSPGEGVDALSEAIDIMRLAWSGEESVSYSGAHYSLEGFEPGPPPAHDIAIILGAYKPRMLQLTGEKADGWIPSVNYQGTTPEGLGESGKAIDRAAEAAGRDPSAIRRWWNVGGDRPADELAGWAEQYNVDGFVFWVRAEDQAEALEQVERLGGLRAELV
jgi:alkanesulfonate monooxygenase SsuD/methylene tetrahydromethanopterin reductase-like flavin-dependent oxidoreductase (luciferase family)